MEYIYSSEPFRCTSMETLELHDIHDFYRNTRIRLRILVSHSIKFHGHLELLAFPWNPIDCIPWSSITYGIP